MLDMFIYAGVGGAAWVAWLVYPLRQRKSRVKRIHQFSKNERAKTIDIDDDDLVEPRDDNRSAYRRHMTPIPGPSEPETDHELPPRHEWQACSHCGTWMPQFSRQVRSMKQQGAQTVFITEVLCQQCRTNFYLNNQRRNTR